MRGKIRVGTASWSDVEFINTWYPKGLPPAERLAWYAEHFDLVEINSTFYRVPSRENVQNWCEQTPDEFLFNVKLHRVLSRHSTAPGFLPPDLRPKAKTKKEKVIVTPELEEEIADRFMEAVKPFEDTGKMGAFLLQLSPSFSPRTNQIGELSHLASCFRGKQLAIELRNRAWLDAKHRRETEHWFRKNHVTFVMVDGPDDPHFMVLPSSDAITNPNLAYIRAHGRNAPKYIRGRTVAERFDYDYRIAELKEMARRAARIVVHTDELHIVFNNNKADYAPKAAERFLQILSAKRAKSRREAAYA
ncbi:MAG TPA: DUF72 domain-containing protein [Verrucomicrobiae bacterium]|jgi:uncharacterized protein YecE (DUF72 family)|nr:DUF72 domain-containing protein [Verrucomicrobiae bacterium]